MNVGFTDFLSVSHLSIMINSLLWPGVGSKGKCFRKLSATDVRTPRVAPSFFSSLAPSLSAKMLSMPSNQQINQFPVDQPSSFLRSVANHLSAHFGMDMSGVVVVLPNSRGGVYLKQELVSVLEGKPAMLPTIISMDEFVRRLVPERVVDGLAAQMVLYQSFRILDY